MVSPPTPAARTTIAIAGTGGITFSARLPARRDHKDWESGHVLMTILMPFFLLAASREPGPHLRTSLNP
jgi:hypothetical protein